MEHMEQPVCSRHKHTPREQETVRKLQNRLKRVSGQLGGICSMLEDNRYCGDILIQLAAAEHALQSLGYEILQEHMQSCVVEQIQNGNEAIIPETMDLIRKLK